MLLVTSQGWKKDGYQTSVYKCHQVTVASRENLLVLGLRNIGVGKASTASAGTQTEQNREVQWHTSYGAIIFAEYSAILDLHRFDTVRKSWTLNLG